VGGQVYLTSQTELAARTSGVEECDASTLQAAVLELFLLL
jgi:hypothetical protein